MSETFTKKTFFAEPSDVEDDIGTEEQKEGVTENDTQDEITPCMPKSRPKDELKKLAMKMFKKEIFTDRHISKNDGNMLPNIFMPLFFSRDITPESDIGMIYAPMSEAGQMSINGYPMFLECHLVNKADTTYVLKHYNKILRQTDRAQMSFKQKFLNTIEYYGSPIIYPCMKFAFKMWGKWQAHLVVKKHWEDDAFVYLETKTRGGIEFKSKTSKTQNEKGEPIIMEQSLVCDGFSKTTNVRGEKGTEEIIYADGHREKISWGEDGNEWTQEEQDWLKESAEECDD